MTGAAKYTVDIALAGQLGASSCARRTRTPAWSRWTLRPALASTGCVPRSNCSAETDGALHRPGGRRGRRRRPAHRGSRRRPRHGLRAAARAYRHGGGAGRGRPEVYARGRRSHQRRGGPADAGAVAGQRARSGRRVLAPPPPARRLVDAPAGGDPLLVEGRVQHRGAVAHGVRAARRGRAVGRRRAHRVRVDAGRRHVADEIAKRFHSPRTGARASPSTSAAGSAPSCS